MSFRSINNSVENAIGVSKLNTEQRNELLQEQLRSFRSMAPGVIFGETIIASVILFTAFGTPLFSHFFYWAVFLTLAHAGSIYYWYTRKSASGNIQNIYQHVAKLCAFSAFFAIIWAALPVLTFYHDDSDIGTTIILASTGVLFITAFTLALIPQVMFSFVVPMVLGMFIGIINYTEVGFVTGTTALNAGIQITAISFLLVSFLVIISIIALRHARIFARHVIAEMTSREQKGIIGLLLKEYEENSSDWLWEIGALGNIQRPSVRFLDACSMSDDQLSGQNFMAFLKKHCEDLEALDKLQQHIENKEQFREIELVLNIAGKNQIWHLTGKPNQDEQGLHLGYLGIGSDVTSARDAEQEINKLAHCDALTGLMNRASFNKQLDNAVGKLERFGTCFTLLFIDLDRFKLINDTRGHSTGDKLLVQVSERIRRSVRRSDAVARLGGDEFAVILHDESDAGIAAKLAAKLIASLSQSYHIDEEDHKIGASIGIALAPQHGTRPEQILRNADLALYRSKDDGRGVFRFFENQMDADQREKRMLENELRQAMDNDEFELFFQPLVSPETEKPTGIESLIRWHHPIRGLISPDEFIPLAEQSSIIQEIGNWSIMEACRAALDWPEDIVVAVNISGQHFTGSDIVSHTKAALEESGLSPHRLEFEITESLLMENTDEVIRTLSALKELGITIALDDFGTGYSCLSYVLKFPFDKIKIDRSFVDASVKDPSAREILQMISALGKSLNIKITAEGVETVEQIEILNEIECHQFQGYYYARPMRREELAAYYLNQFRSENDTSVPEERREASN